MFINEMRWIRNYISHHLSINNYTCNNQRSLSAQILTILKK